MVGRAGTNVLIALGAAAVLVVSFEFVTSVSTITAPISTWFQLISVSLFAAAACSAYLKHPRNKALLTACGLCAASIVLQLYARSAAARTPAIAVVNWIAIGAMFAGAMSMIAANSRLYRK